MMFAGTRKGAFTAAGLTGGILLLLKVNSATESRESYNEGTDVTSWTHCWDRKNPHQPERHVSNSPSPKLSPSQFEPELVLTLRSVLDTAVQQIDLAHRTPATKAKMAEKILRTASEGVTDSATLTAVAIEEGKQPAD